MDLPTLREFRRSLQENRVFRDYLNTFLNLPIFAKRLTFHGAERTFSIEPRVKTSYHSVNESALLSWVHKVRLPLFWSTDLHLECRLCQALVQSSQTETSDLCSVLAMDCFRQFLHQAGGETTWLFWKDVERLKLSSDENVTQKILHHIRIHYLLDGAPFSLSQQIKEKAVLCVGNEPSSVCRLSLFLKAQDLAFEELKCYWCRRYSFHCDKKDAYCSDIDITQDIIKTLSSEGDTERKIGSHIRLPRIIYDQGKIGAEERPERVPHIHMSSCSLPSLSSTSQWMKCDSSEFSEGSTKDPLRSKFQALITPSTQSLFPKQANFIIQSTSQRKDYHYRPLLSAFLRTDFLAGYPFLRFVTNQNTHLANHLLFWQSVEVLLTHDEMKRWSFRKNCSSEIQLNCREGALLFFEVYPIARSLDQLLRLFVKVKSPYRVDLPQAVRRRELCVLLAKGLGQNLLMVAQDHSAQVLFSYWKSYISHDHHEFMSSCTSRKVLRRMESPHHRRRTLTGEFSPSPAQLLEQIYEPSQLECSWNSLRLAEASKYHGIHLLPSRTLPPDLPSSPVNGSDDLFDLIDIDTPITVEGVALSPMVTTVCDQLLYDWEKSMSKRSILCTTTHSFDICKRPPIPTSIVEILHDREQLEFFRHYLFMHGTSAEMLLQFWMAVEDIKASIDNKRAFSAKLRRIQERFCMGKANRTHMTQHPVFYELSKCEKLNILQIIAAQMEVLKTLEKTWFDEYVQHLLNKKDEDTEKEVERKSACKANTKGLWGMFTHNVISFRRGLMNSATAEHFRGFLREEVIKGNVGHSPKKVIGTKVVNVTKLLNDLSFWVEVERYKDLADMIRAGKQKGTHTPEDDIMVHKKAHAIVNCYVDSAVSPRVQINIPHDLVSYILDNISQGLISRGLFHEAALNIFSVLILYWKKFCVARFAPRKQGGQSATARPPSLIAGGPQKSSQTITEDTRDWHAQYFWEGGPILSFTLTTGAQWHYPPNYHQLLQQSETVQKCA